MTIGPQEREELEFIALWSEESAARASLRRFLESHPPCPPASWKAGWRHVSATNLRRCLKWHPGGLEEWTVSDWTVAAAGEMGEVCDAVKKLNRARGGLQGKTASPDDVGKEIADTVIYLDLLAQRLGFDLADLVQQKFNEVSRREGFEILLEDETDA